MTVCAIAGCISVCLRKTMMKSDGMANLKGNDVSAESNPIFLNK